MHKLKNNQTSAVINFHIALVGENMNAKCVLLAFLKLN